MHSPLLDIPLTNVLLDELHLLMRHIDILVRNLVEDAVTLDDKIRVRTRKVTNKNRKELKNAIQSMVSHLAFMSQERRMEKGR